MSDQPRSVIFSKWLDQVEHDWHHTDTRLDRHGFIQQALADLPVVQRAALVGIELAEESREVHDGYGYSTVDSTGRNPRSGGRTSSRSVRYVTPASRIPGVLYGDATSTPYTTEEGRKP